MDFDTAVVLAGGPGSRLRPVTDNLPKGMIKICGKPLLQWIIEWLCDNGVKHVVLGVAYLKDTIINYFGDGTKFDIDIKYSVHTVKGGTSEGFRLAINRYVNRDVFFAMNGDQITDLNLNDLTNFHMKYNQIATIALTNPRCPYGHVQINDKYDVLEFMEKPQCPHALCNTGIYIFNREIIRYLPKTGDVEKTTFLKLIDTHRLKVYPFRGFFITINTYKDLVEAERELRKRLK